MKTLLLTTFMSCVAISALAAGDAVAGKNVLLIIADDLGVDVLKKSGLIDTYIQTADAETERAVISVPSLRNNGTQKIDQNGFLVWEVVYQDDNSAVLDENATAIKAKSKIEYASENDDTIVGVEVKFSRPNVAKPINIAVSDSGDFVLDENNMPTFTPEVTAVEQKFQLSSLRSLHSKGVYFSQAWANPVCSPTRGSTYTGLYPWRSGVGWADHTLGFENDGNSDDVLPDDTGTKTIANAICDGDTGKTCGLFGKWHLGKLSEEGTRPIDRGWDYYAGDMGGGGLSSYYSWNKSVSTDDAAVDAQNDGNVDGYDTKAVTGYVTRDTIEDAKKWIHAQTGNWFATIALNAPHDPWEVPEEVDYDNPVTYDPATKVVHDDPATTNVNEGSDVTNYNAIVQSMDYYIGKLWDSSWPSANDDYANLNDSLKDTVIVFVGDNGTPGSASPLRENTAKNSVYLGGVHVPMIITDGGALIGQLDPVHISSEKQGIIETTPVNVTDLYKTIHEIMDGGNLANLGTDSFSLNGYLDKWTTTPAAGSERIYNFAQLYKPATANQDLLADATVSDGTYKLNYITGAGSSNPNGSDIWSLHILADDPTEEDNLFDVSQPCDEAVAGNHCDAQNALMAEMLKQRSGDEESDIFE